MGGRGASGGVGGRAAGGGRYQRSNTPHTVTLSNGNGVTFQAQSYGEGWKNGYHVRQTDAHGGEFIDNGAVNGFKIGETVSVERQGIFRTEEVPGKIVMAHKYPNGSVDFTVETKSSAMSGRKDRQTYSSNSLRKRRR